jgi:hypothetical protein
MEAIVAMRSMASSLYRRRAPVRSSFAAGRDVSAARAEAILLSSTTIVVKVDCDTRQGDFSQI